MHTDLEPPHATAVTPEALPGSRGEHILQLMFGTRERAEGFYSKQVRDHLNPRMRNFIARQQMAFIATADARGECDCSFRSGPPGFVQVVDASTVVYPEYRGNGVLASLGNIAENAHVALLFVDFFEDLVGLHVNGRAQILTPGELPRYGLTSDDERAERFVRVTVEEAYIHCSKHIPLLARLDRRRRNEMDGVRPAGSGYFTGASRVSGNGESNDGR